MVVHLVCQCGNDFTVTDSVSGREFRCPKCGRILSNPKTGTQPSDESSNNSDDTQTFANTPADKNAEAEQTQIVQQPVDKPDKDTDSSAEKFDSTKHDVEKHNFEETIIHDTQLNQGQKTESSTPSKLSERIIVEAPADEDEGVTRILDPSAVPGSGRSAKGDSGFDLNASNEDETKYDSSFKNSAGQKVSETSKGSSKARHGSSQYNSQAGSKIAQLDLSERVMGTISRPTVPLSSLQTPDNGDYGIHRILRTHQKGGMGRILIAYDQFLKRDIALKELHPEVAEDISIVRRFIGEAEITAQLEHPGIVPIHVLSRDRDGLPYYTMKLIKGITYQEAIKAYHRNPTKQELMHLIRRLVSICKTISFAHNKGVIHRDLKPANIMLGEHGETLVMDWGLAKPVGAPNTDETTYASIAIEHHANEARPELTMVGAIVGTPAFMSPEQASPEDHTVGPLSDIFSLGTILYYLLVGQTAFSGRSTQEVLNKVRAASPPKPSEIKPNVPLGLEAICAKAMAKDPKERYQSASEMDADLCRWLDGEPVKAQKETLMQSIHRWIDRHRIIAFAIPFAIVLLIVFVNLAVYFDRLNQNRFQEEAIQKVLTKTVDLTDEPSVYFRGSPGISVLREPRMTGGEMVSCRVDVVPKSEHGTITIIAPSGGAWDVSKRKRLQFSIYEDLSANQPNNEAPLSEMFIRIGRGSSFFEYTPSSEWWAARKIRNWYSHTIPLEGSSAWQLKVHGEPLMSEIEWIEIHFKVKTPISFQLDNISFLAKDN